MGVNRFGLLLSGAAFGPLATFLLAGAFIVAGGVAAREVQTDLTRVHSFLGFNPAVAVQQLRLVQASLAG